eukprot:UN05780
MHHVLLVVPIVQDPVIFLLCSKLMLNHIQNCFVVFVHLEVHLSRFPFEIRRNQ